jgi:hypothetical protein
VIGRVHYIAALKALQLAFVSDGTKDLRQADDALADVEREVAAWREDLETERERLTDEDIALLVPTGKQR